MSALNIVLENKRGEVIRSFRWTGARFKLIQRRDSRRLEPLIDEGLLKKQKIDFELILDVSMADLKKKPVAVPGLGQLRILADKAPKKIVKDVELPEENSEKYLSILRWSAISHFALVGILLLLGLWILPMFQEEERVIEIVAKAQPLTKKKVAKVERPSVKVSKKKIKKRKQVRAKKIVKKQPRRTKRVAQHRGKSKARVQPQQKINVNKLGALAALGGSRSGNKNSQGLNVKAVKTNRGSGFSSGKAGSGGALGVVASQGLIAKGVGLNQGAGVGHSGTRGKGGGQPGYGKMSLGGSYQNYSYPLADEAFVQGGLDRAQVDAVIKKHLGEVVYCYEKGLQKSPSLSGRVSVNFVISPRGHVSTAKVGNTSLRSKPVEGCLVKRLKGWKFPKPVGNVSVRVSYPFMMKRVGRG